jgi:hypothetical protein
MRHPEDEDDHPLRPGATESTKGLLSRGVVGATGVTALHSEGIEIAGPISDQGWGLLTAITLPGGVELGLYEPRYPTAVQPG